MEYLSAEEILILHARVIDATGGSHGVRDAYLLASIAVKPVSQFGGVELYKELFSKAAVLFEALVNYHVFVDGNKRIGVITTARFLFINGYELTASNSDVEDVALAIATSAMGMEEIAKWLEKNSKKM